MVNTERFNSSEVTQARSLAFGTKLRELRLRKLAVHPGFTLRGWAKMVGLSCAYISGIENGLISPPQPKHLRIMASLLEEDYEELLTLSGRVADELQEILMDSRQTRELVRECAGLGAGEIGVLVAAAKVLKAEPRAAGWVARVVQGIANGEAGERKIRV